MLKMFNVYFEKKSNESNGKPGELLQALVS